MGNNYLIGFSGHVHLVIVLVTLSMATRSEGKQFSDIDRYGAFALSSQPPCYYKKDWDTFVKYLDLKSFAPFSFVECEHKFFGYGQVFESCYLDFKPEAFSFDNLKFGWFVLLLLPLSIGYAIGFLGRLYFSRIRSGVQFYWSRLVLEYRNLVLRAFMDDRFVENLFRFSLGFQREWILWNISFYEEFVVRAIHDARDQYIDQLEVEENDIQDLSDEIEEILEDPPESRVEEPFEFDPVRMLDLALEQDFADYRSHGRLHYYSIIAKRLIIIRIKVLEAEALARNREMHAYNGNVEIDMTIYDPPETLAVMPKLKDQSMEVYREQGDAFRRHFFGVTFMLCRLKQGWPRVHHRWFGGVLPPGDFNCHAILDYEERYFKSPEYFGLSAERLRSFWESSFLMDVMVDAEESALKVAILESALRVYNAKFDLFLDLACVLTEWDLPLEEFGITDEILSFLIPDPEVTFVALPTNNRHLDSPPNRFYVVVDWDYGSPDFDPKYDNFLLEETLPELVLVEDESAQKKRVSVLAQAHARDMDRIVNEVRSLDVVFKAIHYVEHCVNQSKSWAEVAKAPKFVKTKVHLPEPVKMASLTVPKLKASYTRDKMYRLKRKLQKIFRKDKLNPELRKAVLEMTFVISAYCRDVLEDEFRNQSKFWEGVKSFLTPGVNVNVSEETLSRLDGVFSQLEGIMASGLNIKSSTIDRLSGQVEDALKSEITQSFLAGVGSCIIAYAFGKVGENTHGTVANTLYGAFLAYKLGTDHPAFLLHSAICYCEFVSVTPLDHRYSSDPEVHKAAWTYALREKYPVKTQANIWSQENSTSVLKAMSVYAFYLIYSKHVGDATLLPFLKEMGDLKKIKTGISEGLDTMLDVLRTACDFVNKFCDSDGQLKVEGKTPHIDDLVQKCSALCNEFKTTDVQYTDTNADRVFQLKRELEEMYNITLPKDPTFAEHRKILWLSIQNIKEISTRFDALSKSKDSTRIIPSCLVLRGMPGVGKSFATKLFLEKVITRTLPKHRLRNYLLHPGNEMWSKPAPDASFQGSGYMDQWAVLIDEWLAATDSKGMDTNQVGTFLKMVSDCALQLDKAQLSEKDNTFFRSVFVLCTTNRESFKEVWGIKHPEALPRRVIGINVSIKREFATEDTKDKSPLERKLDKSKIPDLGMDPYGNTIPFTDLWEFQKWDFMAENAADRLFGPTMTFDQLVNLSVESVENAKIEYSKGTSMRNHERRAAYEERRLMEPDLPPYDELIAKGLKNQSKTWDSFKEWVAWKTTRVKDKAAIVTDDAVQEMKRIFLGGSERLQLARLDAAVEVRGHFQRLKETVSTWLQKPYFRSVVILGGLIGAVAGLLHYARPQFEAQSGEPKRGTGRVRDARWRPGKHTVLKNQGNRFSCDFDLIAAKVFARNVVQFCNYKGEDLGFILMLQKSKGIMPGHFQHNIREALSWDPDYTVMIQRMDNPLPRKFLLREMKFTEIPGQDLVGVELPKSCLEFNDITHMIAPLESEVFTPRSIIGRITPMEAMNGNVADPTKLTGWQSFKLIMTESDYFSPSYTSEEVPSLDNNGQPIKDEKGRVITHLKETHNEFGFMTPIGGVDGFCGLPFLGIGKDKSVLIAGLHTAGSSVQSYCAGLTREMLKDFVDFKDKKVVNDFTDDKIMDMFTTEHYLKDHSKAWKNTHVMMIGNATPITVPFKTSLVRSPFFEEFGPCEKYPAMLRPKTRVLEDGGKVVVMPGLKSLEEYCSNNEVINEELAFAVTDSQISAIANASDPPKRSDMYSFGEVVMGVEGVMPSISRSTSPGYRYVLDGLTRKDIFGDGELPDLKRPQCRKLKEDVDKYIEVILSGANPLIVWTNNLKDETRSEVKVYKGETRLFMYACLAWLIVCMMFTGTAQHWLMENCIKNGFAVGVNPRSDQWHALASRHRAMGATTSGDYRGYDKRMHAIWIFCWGRFLHWFYRDQPPNYHKVLDAIIKSMAESVHVQFDEETGQFLFFLWMGGWLSGHYNTATGGSFIGGAKLRYNVVANVLRAEYGIDHLSWTHSHPYDMRELEKNIVTTTQGDDNLLSVSNYYSTLFSPDDVQATFKLMGDEYTNEHKLPTMGPWTDIDARTFLKRKFVYDKKRGKYVAPRDRKDVIQCLYWFAKTCTKEEVRNIVYETLIDLSFGDEEDWKLAEEIIKVSEKKLHYTPPLLTREAFRKAAMGYKGFY